VLDTKVYNPASKRMIVFAGGGPGGYGILNDAWVLTNADGASGTPTWQKLNPVGGPPPARESHVAVYDQASNRMIVQGGYTTPGNCGGVIGDVWVLSNADGTGGAPAWIQLAPTGSAPPRRYAGAAYDAVNNRLILNGGGNSGCGAGLNDTWVLTNANGLGGTPAWIQLTPTTPANFPSDSSGGNAAYDPAHNVFMRFLQWNQTVTTWLLSNANGLGGTPAWTQMNVSPAPSVNDWVGRGGTYDQGANTFVFFGGGVSVASETWKLSGANGIGTPYWTKLMPGGPQPDARVWAGLGYTASSGRLVMEGGSKDSWNGTLEVWTLSSPFGPAAPATLASIAVRPTYATLPAGATQAFAAAGTFTDGSTRTLTATDGLTWATSASTVATVDPTGAATAVAAGAATITASSGSIAGTAALTVTPPPAPQAWTQWSASPDPTYGFPAIRTLQTSVYNTTGKRMILFAGSTGGRYTDLNDVWVLSNADGVSGTPTWRKLLPTGGPPQARDAHVAVYDQANNRMIIQGGYTTPGNCGGVVSDAWVLTNADGTGGAPAWIQLAPTGTAPPRRYAGAAYDAVNNRLILNGGGNSGCGAGLNDTWVLTNANGLGGTPSWIQLSPTMPANFPSDSSGGNAAYDPAHNVFMRFLQWNQTVTTWLLSNANGLGGTPAWTQLSASPAPSVNDWVGRGGTYDPGTNTFIFFGGGVSVASETWKLSGANGIGTPYWTKLTPSGPQPVQRIWASLAYAPPSALLTMYGGSEDGGTNGVNEVWTLSSPFGPAAPPTLASIAVRPTYATLSAGATQAFAAAGTFTDGSTRTLTATDGLTWATSASTVATVDPTGAATAVAAGAATIIASSGSIAGTAALTVTPPPSAQAWTQWSALPDPTYGTPSARVLDTKVYNPAGKRMIVFAGGGPGGYGILNDAWVLTNADGASGTPTWQKLNPVGGPPPAREAHVAVYDQASNRMIVQGGYTTPGNCGGVIGDVWVLSNADGTGGAPAWIQLAPTGTAPPRRYAGAAYDPVNNRLILNGGGNSGCGAGLNDTWVLTNANGLGGTPAWIQLTPTTPANFPSDSSGGNAAYDPAHNVFMRFLQWNQTVTTWLLSNANGLGGTPAWTQLSVSPAPSVNDWVGRGGTYDQGANTFVFFGGGVSVASETWTLSGANGIGTPQWTKLTPSGPQPDARVWAGLGYTASSGRLVMEGGSKDSWNGTLEVWTLSNPFAPGAATYVTRSTDNVATLVSSLSNETVVPVSTGTQATAYAAATSSQGLVALGSFYDLRPSPVVFNPTATLSLTFDPTSVDTTTVAIYWYNGVSWDSAAVSAQTVQVLGPAQAVVSGQLAHASLYAAFWWRRDSRPPRTSLVVGTPSFNGSVLFVTPATPLGLTAVDDKTVVGDGIGAGVARTFYGVDSSSYAAYAGTFTLTAEGTHAVTFYSVDLVGNTEVAHSSAVAVDATAPRTSLLVQGGRQFPGPDAASFYASSDTRFTFAAIDPLVNGAASGVAWTRYQDSTGAFQNYVAALALAEGAHRLAYQSQDNVGNLEVARSTNVLVDATAPTTTVSVGSPTYAAPDGTIYVAPTTPVTFAAADPALPSGQAGSGVARIEVSVDGGAFSVYVATLTFAEGRHSILYRAVDNVGNVEAAKTLALQSDATPPFTALKASGAFFAATAPEGTRLYAPPAFVYSLPATDPTAGNVASGVAFTRYRTGPLTNYASGAPTYAPGAFANDVSTFSLAEGVRRVDFQSQDNVANLELLKSATVFVDATPPATTLGIGAPQYAAGGTLYVSTATPFTLAAQDPVVQEVASGVSAIFFHRDADPAAPYASAFALALPDGAHAVSYYAVDNVGNLEAVKTSTVALDATAPQTSLLVLGGRQFPGPDGRTFYASSDTRFALPALDPLVNGAASGLAFTRWQDNGGAFTVYVATLSLAEGAHALGYQSQDNVANLEALRSTTVLVDATAPASAVTIGSPTYTAGDGTIYVTPATPVVVSAADPALPSGQAGSGVARIEVSVDGAAFAAYAGALAFAEGRHALLYRAVDNVGNVEAAHALALQSDATPPISALAIGQPQFALSSAAVLVSSRTPLSIAAADPVVAGVASGVRQSFYSLGGGTVAAFNAPFTLSGPDGTQTVAFYSQDNVLNTEAVKVSTVVLDATPPELALLSPASCDAGICRVVKGALPVLGTARDAHFAGYVLDFAPGQNATTGYALISSGTVAVSSGALGTWDASKLAGWQTLRLTATDLVQNVSSVSLGVYVGDPATLMVLGNHDAFDMPTGVAVGADGKIYVADRDNDRVAVFSSTGAPLAAFGGLAKPTGVAVDAAGDVFVADTGHDRVLELSATGQVLLTLGRLRKPAAVALDAGGRVYVSDTGNHRVEVFSSTGGFLSQIVLPAAPRRDDDERDEDDAVAALGKPLGLALDAAGDLYVADVAGRRALKYDPTGALRLTIPIPGDAPGQAGRPFGVAVSSSGECLLVSDMQFAHVLKFDIAGTQNLSFGARARGDDAARKAAVIALRKPAGLALDAAGNLYVADRNAERIEKFGLPTGQATLVVPPARPDDEGGEVARDVLDKDGGGTVSRRDHAAVQVPAGALADDLKITVSTMSAQSAAQADAMGRMADGKGLRPAYAPVEYGPEGTKFVAPVVLTVPYNPALVAQQGLSEDSLKVHYWNKLAGDWEALESVVDKTAHTVTAKTPHFSLYQVLGSTGAGIGVLAADASFGLKAAYAFPNPVHGGAVTLRIQPGLADTVSVRVYDVSGRKVHDSSGFSLSTLDDGNGLGAQFTYDHVWDVSGVGSGVYTYVITATKAGQADIHKTGRIGVAK